MTLAAAAVAACALFAPVSAAPLAPQSTQIQPGESALVTQVHWRHRHWHHRHWRYPHWRYRHVRHCRRVCHGHLHYSYRHGHYHCHGHWHTRCHWH
jgi:hypothetical protein